MILVRIKAPAHCMYSLLVLFFVAKVAYYMCRSGVYNIILFCESTYHSCKGELVAPSANLLGFFDT